MLAFNKETIITEKETPRNITNIYVNIFGKYKQFWHLIDVWII